MNDKKQTLFGLNKEILQLASGASSGVNGEKNKIQIMNFFYS